MGFFSFRQEGEFPIEEDAEAKYAASMMMMREGNL
jgi:hypothetical protein